MPRSSQMFYVFIGLAGQRVEVDYKPTKTEIKKQEPKHSHKVYKKIQSILQINQ